MTGLVTSPAATTTRRPTFHPLTVQQVERLTDEATAITFAVPAELAEVYRFAAGQHLTLRRVVDGAEVRNSYSICQPARGELPTSVRVAAAKVPGGRMSPWLVDEVAVGDVIDVMTPMGTFTCPARPQVPRHHLAIAAGSGITPVLSLVTTALEQEPTLRGRVTLSHAYCLAQIDAGQLNELAGRMAALGVSLASCLPIGKNVMPLPSLRERGVRLLSGTDSVIDHWSPFGSASMLEKAHDWARLYTQGTEFELSRALAIATGHCLPLSDSGEVAWPQVNDEASFMLLNAACSAQVVARLPGVEAVYFRGKRVWIRE